MAAYLHTRYVHPLVYIFNHLQVTCINGYKINTVEIIAVLHWLRGKYLHMFTANTTVMALSTQNTKHWQNSAPAKAVGKRLGISEWADGWSRVHLKTTPFPRSTIQLSTWKIQVLVFGKSRMI